MDIKEETGRRLKAARKNAGLSLDDVCALLPWLIRTTLNSYERGSRMLPVETAKKLAPIYSVSAAFLLTVEDQEVAAQPVLPYQAIAEALETLGITGVQQQAIIAAVRKKERHAQTQPEHSKADTNIQDRRERADRRIKDVGYIGPKISKDRRRITRRST